MKSLRILSIFGTRPEVIKFIPVLKALEAEPSIESIIGVTGQHREMLQQMLELADLTPQFDLAVMRPNQRLHQLTATMLEELTPYLEEYQPDRVLVQGDTTTGYAAALACFYLNIPVGHIEAGLRSHDMKAPWPEEMNRKSISILADMHFAPTQQSAQHLLAENIAQEQVWVTGNTVVDALYYFSGLLQSDDALQQQMADDFRFLSDDKKLILVTMHRREHFDGGIEAICKALLEIASREDVQLVFPVHLNPNVKGPVEELLSNQPNIHLIAPQDYLHFLYLMNRATLILSDSGGVQEEAPSLQKPVLVLRSTTERPEGVEGGAVKLVGSDPTQIVQEANRLLDDELAYRAMQQGKALYGDGTAAQQIVRAMMERHGLPQMQPTEETA